MLSIGITIFAAPTDMMTDFSGLVVRPIQAHDLDGLVLLAAQTGGGMTTLKADRSRLGERIEISSASFLEQLLPAQRDYLFVMEQSASQPGIGIILDYASVLYARPRFFRTKNPSRRCL